MELKLLSKQLEIIRLMIILGKDEYPNDEFVKELNVLMQDIRNFLNLAGNA